MKNSIKILIVLSAILFTVNVYAEEGWITEDGKIYYYENDNKVSGFKEIEGKLYFFSRVNNILKTGWQEADEGKWYQNEDGEVLTGLQEIEGEKYLFNEKGIMQTGFVTSDEKLYFYSRVNGVLKSGWQNAEEGAWYQNEEGEVLTGPQEIDNEKYLFNEKGIMQTGFITLNEKLYFFSRVNGILKSGWQNAAEGTWYQNEEGEVLTGLQEIDNEKYYFNENGILKNGFIRIDDKLYFFSRVNNKLKTGWQNATEGIWYQNKNGEVVKGLQEIDNEKYYFNENGILKNGFIRIDDKLYFFSRVNNKLKTGWQNAAEGIWYQDENGIVNEKEGLVIINGKEYYFQGIYAQIGIVNIDDKDYYFNEEQYYKEYGICEVKYKKYYLNEDSGEIERIQTKPYYYNQKDSRWANIKIGSSYFGNTGCVPTSLAMAYSSIKEREILPIDIGRYLYNNTDQFNKRYKGASGKAVIYASNYYGINYKNIYTKEDLIEELEKGNIVYGTMQNGKFATPRWNHAILIYDYSNDKVKTIASDPLNINNNGWVDINLVWAEKNTDPDDLTGGSALYSLW